MKKHNQMARVLLLCLFLGASGHPVSAQDASHEETARTEDSSDWGLLGLIGLVGLLGLRKKPLQEDQAGPKGVV